MGRAARLNKSLGTQKQPGAQSSFDPFNQALEALAAGNRSAAIVHLRQAILQQPKAPRYHAILATALRDQGAWPEAIAAFRDAMALQPRYMDAALGLAETQRRCRLHADALATVEQILSWEPRRADGYLARAAIKDNLGDHEGAMADVRHAIGLDPRSAPARRHLATLLLAADRKVEALECLEFYVKLNKKDAEVYRFIADTRDKLGMVSAAFEAYRESIAINPQDPVTYTNLAGLLCQTKMLDLALSVGDIAIQLAPNLSGAHFNRGVALEQLGRLDDALLAYAEAIRCQPDHGKALISMCRLRAQICDWEGLEASQGLARTLTYRKGALTAPFAVLAMTPGAADLLHSNKVWSDAIPAPREPLAAYVPREPARRHERLRVGYISADFHHHATAALIAELFETHDRDRFETHGYSIGAEDNSLMRQRLAQGLEHFHNVAALTHADAAALIHRHEIDILIDLKGYTFQARAEILALRPAPIQINYLGYPSTMGARFIDYIIGDRFVTPREQAHFFSEKIIQLPDSYQPNDRKRAIAAPIPSRAECGLPEHGFVFSCFNANYKITPTVFDIWMRLLRDVPDSILWLYEANTFVAANLRREAAARGIAPERLFFAPRLEVPNHLARMQNADLFLDTLPVGAHTTGSEALWTGLPVLTCVGEAFPARVGGSLLAAADLPELIAYDLEAYEAKALGLARSPEMMQAIRAKLQRDRLAVPLFDIERYTRNFEAALMEATRLRDAGEAPRFIALQSV